MGSSGISRVHHTRQMRRRRARRRLERLDLNSILLEVDILLAWERCGVRCPLTWVACFFPSTPLPDELQCSFHHHHHTLHRHSTTLQDLIPDPALLMPDFYPNDIAWLCVDVRAEFVSLGACAVY